MFGKVILLLLIVNFFFLAVYCRAQEKIDAHVEKKRQEKVTKSDQNVDGDSGINAINKSFFKRIAGKCYAFLSPYVYGWMRLWIVICGKLPSHRVRNVLFRYVFNMKITKRTVIYSGCELRSPWNIHADRCVISTHCILDGRRGIWIGQDVVFGSGVHVWTEEHDVDDSWFAVNMKNAMPVKIDSHAWICSDSTLLPGVHIGEGAVVASRACVTKNCEAFGVYGGIPAKKLKERNKDLKYHLNGKPTWHFY